MSHTASQQETPQAFASHINTRGVIQLSGDEKVSYLQGQVTADINKLTENQGALSCHCDFKGKLWSVFYTFLWQDNILLLPHISVLEQSLTEFKKYAVFAKVDLINESEKWNIIGGKGADFETAISTLFGALPTKDKEVVATDNGLVMSLNTPFQRYLVIQPKQAKQQLNCEMSNNENLWEVADIQGGIGDIQKSTINEYVPQMLNLHALDAIDFEKGCYMGQEVVARTKYLGRNKRAGFILTTKTLTEDLCGQQLEYQVGENWRPGGKILRCGSDQKQTWVFAVLPIDTQIGSSFRLKGAPDTNLIVQALPYPLQ